VAAAELRKAASTPAPGDPLLERLVSFGVTRSVAAELVAKFPAERIRQQLDWMSTRHGVEVARLIPASRPSREEVSVAIARMRATRPGRTVPAAELRAWRTAGRR